MLQWTKTNRHEARMEEALCLIFRNHPKLLEFLFDRTSPKLRQPVEQLQFEAGVYSCGEQILIRVALDLWNGSGEVTLWDLVGRLDVRNYQNVVRGLVSLRRIEDEDLGILWRQPKKAY